MGPKIYSYRLMGSGALLMVAPKCHVIIKLDVISFVMTKNHIDD